VTVLGFWDVVAKVVAVWAVGSFFACGAWIVWREAAFRWRRLRIRRGERARRGWLDGRARL
jgi:hypothetical protein